MNWTVIATAATLGLLGGTHCMAMCAGGAAWSVGRAGLPSLLAFQGARLLSYTALGAALATLDGSLEWMARSADFVRPFWIMLNVAVLLLGGTLLIRAEQPALLIAWGMRLNQAWRSLWEPASTTEPVRVYRAGDIALPQPLAGPRQAATRGLAWALVPCGMLYSALILASFSGRALDGAAAMAAFGLTTGVQLGAAQYWMGRFGAKRGQPVRMERLATRIAGAMLSVMAAYAIWAQISGNQGAGLLCFGAPP